MSEPYHIPPDPAKLILALRAIGYSFDHAVADILDNSITAGAANVLVRLELGTEGLTRVMIADDGKGMTQQRLAEAMRFGAAAEHDDPASLGKYGMGMKLASFSQGREVAVLTRRQRRNLGMRWSVEGVADNWRCDELSDDVVRSELERDWGQLNLDEHGTVVIWSQLDKQRRSKRGVQGIADYVAARLRKHLGLHFHRFIETDRIRVLIDGVDLSGRVLLPQTEVPALNPFHYDSSSVPHEEYPKTFFVDLGSGKRLELNAHIWPPKSTSAAYKLDGNVAARQGLYFYRSDRLIQAGGWNDGADSFEPHSSLARVAVNLPPDLDNLFSLDVKKSGISEPVGFAAALKQAKASDGSVFSEYRSAAVSVYRSAARNDSRNRPIVPGRGLPASLRRLLKEHLAGRARVREVAFVWADLVNGKFFEIDRERQEIRLNRALRRLLLGEAPASSADLPVLKLLLFFLLYEDIDRDRVSQKQRDRLEQLDAALAYAAQCTRD